MELLEQIRQNARQKNRRIVLPEGTEIRTLKAANQVLKEEIAQITLLGNPEVILKTAREEQLTYIEKAEIVNPASHEKKDEYISLLVYLRQNKGMTDDMARKLVENPLYLGVLMIKNGDAHGEVAGAMNATGDVLKPAFQIIKTKPGFKVVSGAFIMILQDRQFGDDGIMLFADCAVNPDPSPEELAEIALSSAITAQTVVGLKPRIAMLSFSTKGSAKHAKIDAVLAATEIARNRSPELQIEGELQADAAIIKSVGQQKAPGSNIAGNANVLVFPDLASGNISYKLVQRLAGAEAIGPILQGMAAPVNDLSRGCSVNDIVHLIAVTANQV
ncbi:MAG: phosphate acetyltransferase [Cyclobacteriaceae bacterium]